MLSIFFIFVGIIFFSAICSMTEAAILSLPVVRARVFVEQTRPHARELLFVKERISDAVAAIVIANNFINIVGSIYLGHLVSSQFGSRWLGVVSAVLTFCIIIISEIIPKTIGERYKAGISLVCARPLKAVILLLEPFNNLMSHLMRPFVKQTKAPRVTEEDIKIMLRLARAEGTVESDEEILCNRVFKLNDVRAFQMMKPIKHFFALPAGQTLGELKEDIIKSRFSRIGVYQESIPHIIGTVQQRILLREIAKGHDDMMIDEFVSSPIFVNWFAKADALLEQFQQSHQHLFIVINSQQEVIGLITMEDVLEELFGEIYDEKDVVKPTVISPPLKNTPPIKRDS